MLIENDILNFENFVIDINKRTIIINSCEIITKLFIKQRDFFVRRNVFSNHKIIVSLNTQTCIFFNYFILENKDFLFESFIELHYLMFYHLMNSYISEVVVRNNSFKSIIISRKFCLNFVSELSYDYCFQISKIYIMIQSFRKNCLDNINRHFFISIKKKLIQRKQI